MHDYKDSAREWHTCKRKRRYKDIHAAERGVRDCLRNYGVEYDYYFCSYCRGYHLTSDLIEEE